MTNQKFFSPNFAEAYQRYPIYFCLVKPINKAYRPMHGLTICREFLNDWVAWNQGVRRYTKYGFTLSKRQDNIKTAKIFWQMDKKQEELFLNNMPVYKQLCKTWGISGKVFKPKHVPTNGYVMQIPKVAKELAWAISFWTLLTKCLLLAPVTVGANVKDTLVNLFLAMKKVPGNELSILISMQDSVPDSIWSLFMTVGNLGDKFDRTIDQTLGPGTLHAAGIQNYLTQMEIRGDHEAHALIKENFKCHTF